MIHYCVHFKSLTGQRYRDQVPQISNRGPQTTGTFTHGCYAVHIYSACMHGTPKSIIIYSPLKDLGLAIHTNLGLKRIKVPSIQI